MKRRRRLAVTLLVIAAILAPLSAVAVWTKRQVTSTERYVNTVAPLAGNPAVQGAVADRATTALTSRVNLEQVASGALPPRAEFLAPSIAAGMTNFVHARALDFARSDAFREAWKRVNRRAHAVAVKLLTGKGGSNVKIQDDSLVLDLGAVTAAVQQRLDERGIRVFDNAASGLGERQLVLFRSAALGKARKGVRALETLALVLSLLTLALLAGGALLFPDRRRGVLWAGVALAAGTVFLLVVLAVGRTIYLDSVPIRHDVAAAFYDTILRFLRDGLRALALIGLLVALGAALAGPSPAAVRVRSFASGGIGRARAGIEGRGVPLGRVGGFTATHEALLRGALLAMACVALLAAGRATIGLVIVLALVVAAGLGLIELFSRAGRMPEAPGPP